jgi:hypothetical protein
MKNPIVIGALVLGIAAIAGGTFYVTTLLHPSSTVEENIQATSIAQENSQAQTNNNVQQETFTFTKDFSHVYVNGQIIVGSDPNTFEFVSENYGWGTEINFYAKDSKQVYFGATAGKSQPGEEPYIQGLVSLSNADPKTFSVININFGEHGPFAKDAKQVYSGSEVIAGADPKSFRIEKQGESYVVRDNSKIYYTIDQSEVMGQ